MVSPSKETAKPSPRKQSRSKAVAGSPSQLKTRKATAQQADEEDKKSWTPRRVEILLECLELAKSEMTGNVEGRNFSPKMSQIASALRRYIGHDFKDNQVKNYWARLKRLHGVFQKLQNQTGIVCDPVQGVVTAEDCTWEEVLLPISYAECKSIQKHGFPLFMHVDAIIGDTRATGSRKHPTCISPSDTDSSDDQVQIKQENEAGGTVDSMRFSGEKRKHVAYEQGGGSSATKKKNQSASLMMAQSMSDIVQSIVKRSSGKEDQATEGGVVRVESKTDKLQRETIRREILLNQGMLMRRDANMTPVESVKCMKLFCNKSTGHEWVNTFLVVPTNDWKDILKAI